MPRKNSRARGKGSPKKSSVGNKDASKEKSSSTGKGTPRRGSTRKGQNEKRHSSGSRSRKAGGRGGIRAGGTSQPRLAGKNKKGVLEGKIELHPDGFGFLIANDPQSPNVYVPKEGLVGVMNKDIVRVQVTQEFQDGKLRGNVVEIVKRHLSEFLAFYRPHGGGVMLVPRDATDRSQVFKMDGEIPAGLDLKSGDTLLCKIVSFPSKLPGTAKILEKVEEPESAGMDTLRVLLEASWPREFTAAAQSEADNAAQRWEERAGKRKDLRKLPFVTIDGSDARDFDDAVCVQKEGDGYRLWVAIADVSLFVKPGTALDKEAFERATSVYFPDHVTPMLPEVLSNGVCSLNPHEDRPCMVCECVIDSKGHIESFDFHEGLMHSHKRMTYEMMQAFMDGEDWVKGEIKGLEKHLEPLVEVFKKLLNARFKRGSIDLEIPEALVILNKDGSVHDIAARTRLSAHRLIEECMLVANQCAAMFLKDKGPAGVYRIHEEPEAKKSREFVEFLSLNGVNAVEMLGKKFERKAKARKRNSAHQLSAPANKSTKAEKARNSARAEHADDDRVLRDPEDYAILIERIRKEHGEASPLAQALQMLMLRTLKQARYSPQPLGHFALAAKDYTHFTSPIRRYPDLMVHRLIKETLGQAQGFDPATDLESRCQHCSDAERIAMDAERKFIEIKKCRYMEDKLGDEFLANVTGVVEKGIFCQIHDHFVDGLIGAERLASWGGFQFEANSMCYRTSGKRKIQLGDTIKVRLLAVDVTTRRIDFEALELVE